MAGAWTVSAERRRAPRGSERLTGKLRRFVALGPVTDFPRDVRERGVSLSESGAAPRAEVRPVLPDELREVWPG